jgi:tetratricopeptide (TPR) repeat protein
MKWIMTLLLLALSAGSARAQPLADDNLGARERHERGSALYDAHRYAEALHEFEVGRALSNRPAFLYNIARCQENLQHWEEAAAAYEAYLPSTAEKERRELAARIGRLRARAQVAPPPAAFLVERPLPPAPARKKSGWLVVGTVSAAVAITVAAVGFGLGFGLGGGASSPRTLEPTHFQ